MSNEKEKTASEAILAGLDIERGIIVGTDKNGNTKTFFMNPTMVDLAIYTKVIDQRIFKNMESGDKKC